MLGILSTVVCQYFKFKNTFNDICFAGSKEWYRLKALKEYEQMISCWVSYIKLVLGSHDAAKSCIQCEKAKVILSSVIWLFIYEVGYLTISFFYHQGLTASSYIGWIHLKIFMFGRVLGNNQRMFNLWTVWPMKFCLYLPQEMLFGSMNETLCFKLHIL